VFLKNDFGEVDEVVFKGCLKTCHIIFLILGIEKSDLDDVALEIYK
jgi:hypothetical protein